METTAGYLSGKVGDSLIREEQMDIWGALLVAWLIGQYKTELGEDGSVQTTRCGLGRI